MSLLPPIMELNCRRKTMMEEFVIFCPTCSHHFPPTRVAPIPSSRQMGACWAPPWSTCVPSAPRACAPLSTLSVRRWRHSCSLCHSSSSGSRSSNSLQYSHLKNTSRRWLGVYLFVKCKMCRFVSINKNPNVQYIFWWLCVLASSLL